MKSEVSQAICLIKQINKKKIRTLWKNITESIVSTMYHSNCPEHNSKLPDQEETRKYEVHSRDKIINVADTDMVQVLESIGKYLKQLL